MIKIQNPNPTKIIKWYAKSTTVKAGQLVKENTGAEPVAAAHDGATLLGVARNTQTSANGLVTIEPLRGAVMEIDYYSGASKQTCSVTDLGTQFDLNVDGTTGEMTLNLDDSGGFLYLVDYDNTHKKAYVVVADADILLSI